MEKRRKRVLIIDDEGDLLESAMMRLKAAGYSVEVAIDGETGLKQARTFKPDTVFVDIVMPEMDGWQVCRELRKDPGLNNAKVAVFTAAFFDGIEKRAQEVHADGVIVKPFDAKDLTDFIEGKTAPLHA